MFAGQKLGAGAICMTLLSDPISIFTSNDWQYEGRVESTSAGLKAHHEHLLCECDTLQVQDTAGIVERLLGFLEVGKSHVTAEAVIQVKDLLRRYPDIAEACISSIASVNLEVVLSFLHAPSQPLPTQGCQGSQILLSIKFQWQSVPCTAASS